MRRNVLNDDALHQSNPISGVDEVHSKVVTDANIRDDCHITLIKRETFAQDASTGSFQYRSIDIWMHQYVPGTAWSTAITSVYASLLNIDAIRVRHANAFAACSQQMGG